MTLAGKTILITGATGALGRAVVSASAALDANLVLSAHDPGPLAELAAQTGLPAGRLLAQAADLTERASVGALLDAIAARWDGADVLLHTAGGWRSSARLADLDDAGWERMIALNLTATFNINRAVLPWMLERGWGRIVNIAARAAVLPGAKQAAYNVAKAGVAALTASIAQDYRRSGITANCLLPGTIDTPANRRSMPEADTSRWVPPAEIAALMLYLASGPAEAVNGAAIPIYGQS